MPLTAHAYIQTYMVYRYYDRTETPYTGETLFCYTKNNRHILWPLLVKTLEEIPELYGIPILLCYLDSRIIPLKCNDYPIDET